jgi:hypothetical protein
MTLSWLHRALHPDPSLQAPGRSAVDSRNQTRRLPPDRPQAGRALSARQQGRGGVVAVIRDDRRRGGLLRRGRRAPRGKATPHPAKQSKNPRTPTRPKLANNGHFWASAGLRLHRAVARNLLSGARVQSSTPTIAPTAHGYNPSYFRHTPFANFVRPGGVTQG